MGKSKKSKNSKKMEITRKPLKNGYLRANILIEEIKVTDIVITWVVKNYSKLYRNVSYFAVSVKNDQFWRLRFIRNPPLLDVCVMTNDFVSDIVIVLRRSDGKVMDKDSAEKYFGNIYNVTFDERNILSPLAKLIDDILIIQFIYTTRPHESTIYLTPEFKECNTSKISDVDMLFNDLKHLYLTASFYDFVLEVRCVKFKVHKLILFKHSKYLARKVREDPDWTGHYFYIDVNPVMMYNVLHYLYSGELRNFELPEVETMLEVFLIACVLEIACLQDICIHFFKSVFSVRNVYDLFTLARLLSNIDLMKEIVIFLNKQPQSVRNTPNWAETIASIFQRVPDDIREINEAV